MIIIRMKWAVNGTFLTGDFELKKDAFFAIPNRKYIISFY